MVLAVLVKPAGPVRMVDALPAALRRRRISSKRANRTPSSGNRGVCAGTAGSCGVDAKHMGLNLVTKTVKKTIGHDLKNATALIVRQLGALVAGHYHRPIGL